jgi:hypothetical protein
MAALALSGVGLIADVDIAATFAIGAMSFGLSVAGTAIDAYSCSQGDQIGCVGAAFNLYVTALPLTRASSRSVSWVPMKAWPHPGGRPRMDRQVRVDPTQRQIVRELARLLLRQWSESRPPAKERTDEPKRSAMEGAGVHRTDQALPRRKRRREARTSYRVLRGACSSHQRHRDRPRSAADASEPRSARGRSSFDNEKAPRLSARRSHAVSTEAPFVPLGWPKTVLASEEGVEPATSG